MGTIRQRRLSGHHTNKERLNGIEILANFFQPLSSLSRRSIKCPNGIKMNSFEAADDKELWPRGMKLVHAKKQDTSRNFRSFAHIPTELQRSFPSRLSPLSLLRSIHCRFEFFFQPSQDNLSLSHSRHPISDISKP